MLQLVADFDLLGMIHQPWDDASAGDLPPSKWKQCGSPSQCMHGTHELQSHLQCSAHRHWRATAAIANHPFRYGGLATSLKFSSPRTAKNFPNLTQISVNGQILELHISWKHIWCASDHVTSLPMQRYASTCSSCQCVCLGIVWKWLSKESQKQCHKIAHGP